MIINASVNKERARYAGVGRAHKGGEYETWRF